MIKLQTLIELNTIPKLISKKFTASGIGDVQENLCSRQVIKVPLNDSSFRFELLSEFERSMFDAISVSGECVDFSQIPAEDIDNGGVIISEYDCSSNYFTVAAEYLNYIKKTSTLATLMIKVYGAEFATDATHKTILQKLQMEVTLPTIGDIPLEMKLDYLMFEETGYNIIDGESGRYFVLNINLPFSYYSRIPLMDSTFSYDINTQKFYIEGNIIANDKVLDAVLENHSYFSKPVSFPGVYVLANNNDLVPFSRQGTDIFMAKFLKLPYIPATLVISDAQVPFFTNKGRKCLITIEETNDLCKPYFIL